MSYFHKIPQIGEIVIVPLAQPNGIYIRLDNRIKVPILAKVRAKYAEMVNVINVFGYTYNVPISHTKPLTQSDNMDYYINMVNVANEIMKQHGYKIHDNTDFYNTIPGTSYPFFSYLPGYDQSPIINSPNINISHYPSSTIHDMYDNDNSISVVKIDDGSLLHSITKTHEDIIFDHKTGQLDIKGYGIFVVDAHYSYIRKGNVNDYIRKSDIGEYIIFRSKSNFIHVRKTHVRNGLIKNDKDIKPRYKIRLIRPNRGDVKHTKYFNIIEIIHKELSS